MFRLMQQPSLLMTPLRDVLEFADAGSATLNGEALKQTVSLSLIKRSPWLWQKTKSRTMAVKKLFWPSRLDSPRCQSVWPHWKGKTVINNKRLITLPSPNDPNFHKDSNIVPVTPQNPENPPIEKKVNEAELQNLGGSWWRIHLHNRHYCTAWCYRLRSLRYDWESL